MATSARSRPSVRPEALAAAARFPVLEAIFTRRARRFALGAELTGPLAYRSEREPVPLAEEEEAILVAAATGVTGVVREEWPFVTAEGEPTGADKLASYTGRPWPSPLAIHGTELFWTNDEGVFVLPQRDVKPARYVQNQTLEEQRSLYRQALKLKDGRLGLPCRRPNLFKFNEWIVNREGTTLFIPIADVTRQCISALLLYFDRPHGYYLKDMRLGADPLRPFMDSGLFRKDAHPYDIADFERWQMVDMNGVEAGLMVENLMLATQALGLGGHPFSGGKGRVTMGGEPLWHAAGGEGPCEGLGFTFHRVPDDAPVGAGELVPVGLPGVFEGACPPFHPDMDAAVDHVVSLRFGEQGIFSAPEAQQIPWRSPEVARAVPPPSEEAIEATKTLCRYIWNTYGRFPATIDPFLTTVWYQSCHLDVDFYDRFYPDEALPPHVRSHMRDWHGL
jgi:nitroreductase